MYSIYNIHLTFKGSHQASSDLLSLVRTISSFTYSIQDIDSEMKGRQQSTLHRNSPSSAAGVHLR
jgi:hypothetical protein